MRKVISILLLPLLCAVGSFPQTINPVSPAPQITAEQRAKFAEQRADFWRLQAEILAAKLSLQALDLDMQKVCGGPLTHDNKGPVCPAMNEKPKKD